MFTRKEIMDNICEGMTALQGSRGINNEQLARLIGVTSAAISQFRTRKRLMTLPILCKICFALNTSLETMVGYKYQDTKKIGILTDKINDLTYERDKLLRPLLDDAVKGE
jgi:DNA-binding Xre family transcriptional regulator